MGRLFFEGEKMATIEIVDFKTSRDPQVNISKVVGAGQINDKNDVMTIQTLFRLVGFSDYHAKKNFGLTFKDLPEITGTCDAKTIRAIWAFQRKMAHRLRNIDGKVHPGNYKNRVLKEGQAGRQMMITLLNLNAQDGAIMNSYGDVVSAVKKISPTIIFNGKDA